jgi:hypothetical protein
LGVLQHQRGEVAVELELGLTDTMGICVTEAKITLAGPLRGIQKLRLSTNQMHACGITVFRIPTIVMIHQDIHNVMIHAVSIVLLTNCIGLGIYQ